MIKPLTDTQMDKLKLSAVKRILRSEKAVAFSGAAHVSGLKWPDQGRLIES